MRLVKLALPIVICISAVLGCGYQLGISPDKLPGGSRRSVNPYTDRLVKDAVSNYEYSKRDGSACRSDPDVGLAQRKANYLDSLAGEYSDMMQTSNDDRATLFKLNQFGAIYSNSSSCIQSLVRKSTWVFGRSLRDDDRRFVARRLMLDRSNEGR